MEKKSYMTVKQFLNFVHCIQFDTLEYVDPVIPGTYGQTARKASIQALYKGFFLLAPRVYCVDGTHLSIQNHNGAHCAYEGIETKYTWYSASCNMKPTMVETDSEDLSQYGMNTIDEVEEYVKLHGGIDLDKTIEVLWEAVNKIAQ